MFFFTDTNINDIHDMIAELGGKEEKEVTFEQVHDYLKNVKDCKDPFFVAISIFRSLDTNCDSKISLNEIKTHKLLTFAKQWGGILERNINKMLLEYDDNNDNVITWEEARNVFSTDPDIGENGCEISTKNLFHTIDSNKDRKITKDEIKAYLENLKK
ncbi:hypothetical protein DICPUDRAFT_95300 [Dictyostelium purpureum]|uniref:EF-hand domain-containing protein n=1 Tax=Dictyostelium purpureum TaxID=5786 RepID=F0ZUQ9_DICPU|nr:uncharacterized protein DICPUDRAFT_95300 [Dictyostelium purpureum]EGC32317.1 hypothetical protein DICPUDRAFT_95300 [Dictyostelium purpureum]|eukprot:XP_003291159.1 hypothetical protein DICPUDRAFT_95300 [Dictyostelium purpureum]